MKVALLSENVIGGAGGAALRLHQGLLRIGVNSTLLVQRELGQRPAGVVAAWHGLAGKLARWRPVLDKLPVLLYPDRQRPAGFHPQWLPGALSSCTARLRPDVVNLHWVCGGYLRIETLCRFHAPVVWTLHDMWPFTGGCFYSQDCQGYTAACGACPQLGSHRTWDLSRRVWRRKAAAWQTVPLTIVSPSSWLADLARKSSLMSNASIQVIPNGLDAAHFSPSDQSAARSRLGLATDKRLVAFAAGDMAPRKGFALLLAALRRLAQTAWKDRVELVVVGPAPHEQPSPCGVPIRYLGWLTDQLPAAYAAADVLVAPSLHDNLPCTVMEALACGTPCVAFNVGGLPDLIDHGRNGYVAQPGDVEDLARGIAWVLEDDQRRRDLGRQARMKVEQQYTLEVQARRYSALFQRVLAERSRPGLTSRQRRAGQALPGTTAARSGGQSAAECNRRAPGARNVARGLYGNSSRAVDQ